MISISNAEIAELVKILREAGELRTLLGTSNGTEEPDARDDMARMRYESHYLIEAADALEALAAERDDWRQVGAEVLAGLDARVAQAIEAGGTAVPVFNGIADLHRLVHSAPPSLQE